MKQTIDTSLVDDSSYLPPLADDRNIQPRLVRLSSLLEEIMGKLVDCPFVAKAYGYVDASIRLELVNFDVMNAVCDTMQSVQFCNALRTLKEEDASDLVKEAAALASDLLIDMPLGLGLGVEAINLPDYSSDDTEAVTAIHESPEEESVNLTSVIETTIFRGYVRNLKRMVTKHNETMASFEVAGSYKIVALPRTWMKYGEELSRFEQEETYIAIKVQAWETGDYGLMELIDPMLPVAENPTSNTFYCDICGDSSNDLDDFEDGICAACLDIILDEKDGE